MKKDNSIVRQSIIMFTDIVGYSKMVESDEKHAIKILNEHNDIIENIISKSNGRIIKHIGDAIFAEYESPINAVNAAVNFQTHFRDRNELCRKEEKIIVRAGIHKGDVIEQDDDLFGNAVNLGSRIESIANPGGIAISKIINDEISKEINSRSMGHIKLKNIAEPIEIYKVYLNEIEYNSEDENSLYQSQIERGVKIVDINSFKQKAEYSIGIVYPYVVGGDEVDYSCYTFLQELIENMMQIDGLRLPSIQDVLKYRNSESSISEIARKLEVQSIIESTYSIIEDDIVLSLRMVNCESGKLIWDKKIKSKKINVNQLRAEIISLVLNEYELTLPENIKRFLARSMTQNSKALDYYHKGFFLLEKTSSNDDLEESAIAFEKAFNLDKGFIEPRMLYGVVQSKLGNNEKAENILQTTLEIAEKDDYPQGIANAYNGIGFNYSAMNRYSAASEAWQNALKIQKNLDDRLKEAKMLSNLSSCYNSLNDPETAKNFLAQAIRIQEEIGEDRTLAFPYAQLGNSCKILLDYSGAIANYTNALAKFTSANMDYWRGRVMILLSEVYIFLGMDNKAIHYLDQSEIINKEFNESLILGSISLQRAQLLLRKKDYNNAIDFYLDSIDQFQIAESRVYLLESIFQLCIIYIIQKEYKSIDRYAKQLQSIAKKNQNDLYEFRSKMLLVYCSLVNKKDINNKLEDINKDINSMEEDIIDPLDWWLLGQLYLINNQKNISEESFAYVESQIKFISNRVSDQSQKESYCNNNVFNLIARMKGLEESINKVESPKPKFCSECGTPFSGGKFCSECGFKF